MDTAVFFACNWLIEEVDIRYIYDSFWFAEESGCDLTLLRDFWEDGQGYGYLTLVIKTPSIEVFEQFKSRTHNRLEHLDWRQVTEKTFQLADRFPEDVNTFTRKLDYLQYMLIHYARNNRHLRFSKIAEPVESLALPDDFEQALKQRGIWTVGELYDAFFRVNRCNLDSSFLQENHVIVSNSMTDNNLQANEEVLRILLIPMADTEIYASYASRFADLLPPIPEKFNFGRNPRIPELISILENLKDCRVDYYRAGDWWDAHIQKDGLKAFIQAYNPDDNYRPLIEFTMRGDFALAREVGQAIANQYGSFFLLGFDPHKALLIPV